MTATHEVFNDCWTLVEKEWVYRLGYTSSFLLFSAVCLRLAFIYCYLLAVSINLLLFTCGLHLRGEKGKTTRCVFTWIIRRFLRYWTRSEIPLVWNFAVTNQGVYETLIWGVITEIYFLNTRLMALYLYFIFVGKFLQHKWNCNKLII